MQKIAYFSLSILAFFFLFSSCSELTGGSTGANEDITSSESDVGGRKAIEVENGRPGNSDDEGKLKPDPSVDDRKFLFEGTASNGGNSGHNFRLRFKLPESKVLTFHFFSNERLLGGVNFTFKRASDGVLMAISLNGLEHTHTLKNFASKEIIDLDLDIHNDHTDAHLLVWDRFGAHQSGDDCTFDGGCLYNSEDFAFDHWPEVGKASGVFWGMTGDRELVLTLEGPYPALSDV